MRDEATTLRKQRWQHFAHETLEIAMDPDLGKDRVPCLFESEQQSRSDLVGLDRVTLPEAALGSGCSHHEEPCDPEARNRRNETPEDRRSRQGHHEIDPPLRRWRLIERDGQLEPLRLESNDLGRAQTPAYHPDPQQIAGGRAEDLLGVLATTTGDVRPTRLRVEILRLEQQAVHGSWSPPSA